MTLIFHTNQMKSLIQKLGDYFQEKKNQMIWRFSLKRNTVMNLFEIEEEADRRKKEEDTPKKRKKY